MFSLSVRKSAYPSCAPRRPSFYRFIEEISGDESEKEKRINFSLCSDRSAFALSGFAFGVLFK
jgi:hypothetical protein